MAVKGVRVGETVGYGGRFTADRPVTLAVIPAGYADGLDRRLEDHGFVLIRGRRAQIVGAVSMDMLTVDVTDIDGVGPGDEVVFLASQGDKSRSTRERWPRGSARSLTRSCVGLVPALNGDTADTYANHGGSRQDTEPIRRDHADLYERSVLAIAHRQCDCFVRLRVFELSTSAMKQRQDRFRVPGVRRAGAEVAGQVPRLRRVELVCRRARQSEGRAADRPEHRYAHAGIGGAWREEIRRHRGVDADRISTGIGEFDRVLGGGIVPGSLVLLGGEPGIGKSTLLLQAAANFARTVGPVLYASGEESEHQIKSRGDRLGVGDAPLYLLAETCIERILEEVGRVKPALLIVDSVQTVFSLKFQSAPGSIGQVREAATQFLFTAKGHNIPTFLVGHVTKDGNLAGPKALEHVVDTVLYFEGERHHSHRVVRAVKNRFGAISELGVFEMTGAGLRPVPNPSALFLAERPTATPGLRRAVLPSKGRGRSSSKCRRSSAPAATATRGGWPSASIRTGCRCCSPCSRSAPACTWSPTMCS